MKLLDRWNLFIGGKIRPFYELIFKRKRIIIEKVSKKDVDEKISTKGAATEGGRGGEGNESGSRGRGRRR